MANANETAPATPPAHTPVPWILCPNGEIKAQAWVGKWDDYICRMPFGSMREAEELGPSRLADAHFIVRACNSHDDLLEACELLVRSLGYWMESESERGRQHANDQEAMRKGVAAIVRAKSQTC